MESADWVGGIVVAVRFRFSVRVPESPFSTYFTRKFGSASPVGHRCCGWEAAKYTTLQYALGCLPFTYKQASISRSPHLDNFIWYP